MRETGILSIVKRGSTSQVHYASFNPYDIDRLPYPCPDEGALVALLHNFGINAWSLQQAVAVLRKGGARSCLWSSLRRSCRRTFLRNVPRVSA
jgi:hypothetical protein